MNNLNIEKISTLLDEFSSFKKQYFDNFTAQCVNFLSKYSLQKKGNIENAIKRNLEIFQSFSDERDKMRFANKETSFLFNPLRFFEINEPKHSFLIAKLLNPFAEHGQGTLFLEKFFDLIGIDYWKGDKWTVYAEKRSIDIIIKRQYPTKAVVVIENKSNNALDRPNQLYRYWLQEMFMPNDTMDYRYTLDTKKSYRLIYLIPDNTKPLNQNSLEKPNWVWLSEKYPVLPNKIDENDILKISFNKDIIDWLESCLGYLVNNHRLREYTKQYIEFWNFKK